MTTIETDCCVVGGGPAGMMTGLLFARAGVKTIVLEKHGDFLRDFRGDTVHPSTLEIMHELGFAEAMLQRAHQKIDKLAARFGDQRLELADLTQLPCRYKFIAMMPQWDFLDCLAGEAEKLETFSLRMNCTATELVEESGRVVGIKAVGPDGPVEIRAKLTIGADGRHSTVREKSGLKVETIGAPIDVFWFRVRKGYGAEDGALFNADAGHIVVTIDRGDYWQSAYVIDKGQADAVRGKGLDAFKESCANAAPHLAEHIGDVASWDDVKLLTVAVDRLERWSRPGLLCIGDSAHAMSPVGGVGINLAVQDAVATANLIAGKLAARTLEDDDLDSVRERRLFPTRATQFMQVQAHRVILAPIIGNRESAPKPPLPMRLVSMLPWLQRKTAALLGLGVRPEHVHSPNAFG